MPLSIEYTAGFLADGFSHKVNSIIAKVCEPKCLKRTARGPMCPESTRR
jgi:hypothetical protein